MATRIGINGFGRMGRASVKVLAWYDNEIGCVNRMMELARKVALSLPR